MDNNKVIKKNNILFKVLSFIFFILFSLSMMGNVYLYQEYNKLNKKLDSSYNDVKQYSVDLDRTEEALFNTQDMLKDKEKELNEANKALYNILDNNKYTATEVINKLYFLDQNIVIIPESDSEHYYTYDCYVKKFNDSGYWALNKQSAKSQGFTAGSCK